jgi:hypothetical protein
MLGRLEVGFHMKDFILAVLPAFPWVDAQGIWASVQATRVSDSINCCSPTGKLETRQRGTTWSRAALPYRQPRPGPSDISDRQHPQLALNTRPVILRHYSCIKSHATRIRTLGYQTPIESSSRLPSAIMGNSNSSNKISAQDK